MGVCSVQTAASPVTVEFRQRLAEYKSTGVPRQHSMNKGFTLIELMVVIAIVAVVAAYSIPNLLRAQLNANQLAAKTTCTTVMTEAYTFNTTKYRLPDRISDLSKQIGVSVLSSTFDQNADDSVIATDGTGAPADKPSTKGYKFIFLYKLEGEIDEHETIRGLMAAPAKFGRSGEHAYYTTTDSGQVFVWRDCFTLAVNSAASLSQATGESIFFKPAGTVSVASALVSSSDMDSSFVPE